ncbi:hydroxymethylglutaryl-CoA synthase [Colletotrichum cuscutae]|uniref:Hydroxymethylglutaryl-CoA synthase n=1 Tax=Colletotrichum cuscutae TaxID=1209917 RepID=A0AAI9UQQ2_9PEZI|nr:hydroxymethylglutaryl-CoA synthase [Colletotrichum cuscutae]
MAYPENVGIKAMEIYVPGQCLDQSLFEQHQGVSAGKYTIGLGLKYMNFCNDREALDGCYQRLREKVEAANQRTNGLGPKTDTNNLLNIFNYMAFHTPNCKIVSKSYGRLLYNDFRLDSDKSRWEATLTEELRRLSYEESLKSKELEKIFVTQSKDLFKARVEPCIAAPTLCGNMYTASLYCSLISLISHIDLRDSVGKTIGMFSYGSGIASTLYGLKITGDLSEMVQKIDLMKRLEQREICTPEQYEEACFLRLKAYGAKGYEPAGSIEVMAPGTYYLQRVDDAYRRFYAVKS